MKYDKIKRSTLTQAEQERVAAQLSALQRQAERQQDQAALRERIAGQIVHLPPEIPQNKAQVKRALRLLIREIIVRDGKVVEIAFV